MRKALKIALIIVSVIAVITLAGVLLYRFFIGSRIQDGGRMENPDAYRAGKELVEFEWRQNHRNYFFTEILPGGRYASADRLVSEPVRQ